MSERGDEEEQDGFITLPPGIAPPSIDVDSGTHRVQRRARDEITFFPGAPGAPVAQPEAPAEVVASSPPGAPDEATRMAPARHAPAWRITLPGAGQVTVDAPLYVGRNPTVPADAPTGRAVSVDDPAKSVSKTHALFEVEAGELWVADLDSTNGVWIVTADGDATQVAPGRPMQVPVGADVELGELVVQVEHG